MSAREQQAMAEHFKDAWRPETRLVHEGAHRSQFDETSEALFLTQGHVYESAERAARRFTGDDPGFQYARFANPTVCMFEERLAALEGAEVARATASGMAAVTAALLGSLRAGDHIVAGRTMFGSCRYIVSDLLPRFGVEATLVDGTNLDDWRAALRPNTRVLFCESPANPTLEVVDLAGVASLAREAGARLVVDNAFATPWWQKPLELGADLVIYSATKHIDGQGRCLGGVVLGSAEIMEKDVQTILRQTGPTLSPFNAWVFLKSLETLSLRVEKQTANARHVADAIAGHPSLERLIYPGRPDHPQADIVARQMTGGSTLLALDIRGGQAGAFRFINALRLVLISNNLGDAKSLITHPATTTHQRFTPAERAEMNIGDGLVRLSIGLEHPDDLAADLCQALDTAG